jgi:hypothetical protein
MLKGIISLILYLLAITIIHAQNYRAVYPDRTAFYFNGYSMYGLRIDSIGWDADSFLIPNRLIQVKDEYENCFNVYGDSWIGSKIIESSNGYTYFLSSIHDTIKIKTNGKIEESWILYKTDSIVYKATISKCDTISFLGLNDSVKTITLQTTDPYGNHIVKDLDNQTIQLSQHYGLIKTFDFYNFPYYQAEGGQKFIIVLQLAGFDLPQIGFQRITWSDIFDFQPGDVLHILNYEEYPNSADDIFEKVAKRYLSRQNNSGSVSYLVEISRSRYHSDLLSSYSRDTITETYKSQPVFQSLPGEPIFDDFMAHTYRMTDSAIIIPSFYETLAGQGLDCWTYVIADGCFPEEIYRKGLGGPYWDCSGALGPPIYASNELVYYKKSSVIWGTPLEITPPVLKTGEFEVFPNPAKNLLYVKLNDPRYGSFSLSIVNLQGQVVYRNDHYSEGSPVDVMGLKGVYVIKTKSPAGFGVRKVVVE